MKTSSIRFTGMASGLDTESIVKSMLSTEQSKIDSQTQAKTILEWRKDAWKDMNKKVLEFQTKQLSNMRLQGNFNKKNITCSNPNVIELSSGGALPEGVHSIEYISELAKGASFKTTSIKTIGGLKPTSVSSLSDLGITTDVVLKVNEGKLGEDGKLIETEVALSPDMKIGDVVAKIKAAMPNTNVSFDSGAGAFFISSKKTGNSQTMGLSVVSGDTTALSKLGITKEGISSVDAKGSNAVYSYNGVEVESESNEIYINGLKATLKATTKDEITFTSSRDSDSVVEFMKNFVTEYNALITDIHEKLDTYTGRSYQPLTDDQKEEMTDKEIEQWEKKIKDGLLYKDTALRDLTTSMRSLLSSSVDGKSLSSIGISTGNYADKGKLTLDEDKLKRALSEDLDSVVNTITTIGGNLYNDLSGRFKSSSTKSANFLFNDKALDKQVNSYTDKISDLQERYTTLETMYYEKFSAMETAINKLNSQSSWLEQ